MRSWRGVLEVSAAAFLWGTWSLFLRPTGLSSRVTSPIIFAVVGLSGLLLVRFEGAPARWDRRTVLLLVGYSLLSAINVETFFGAMEVTTVAVAVLAHSTAPLIVALLAPYVDGMRVKGSALAALIALAGLTLLLRPWETGADVRTWIGVGLGLISALGYAALIFVVAPLTARIGVARATGYSAMLAALIVLPFASELRQIESTDLLLLVLGGLLPGTLSAALFLDGLARIGSARAAVLALLEPTVAVLVGWLFFGEPLGPIAAVGAALVLGAAAFVATRQRATG